MRRLLVALMMIVALPLGAADVGVKPVLTQDDISRIAASVYTDYRLTQDVYTDGSRRNGDMRSVLYQEKACLSELAKNKSDRLAFECLIITTTGIFIALVEMNTPYPTVRFYQDFIADVAAKRFYDEASKFGYTKKYMDKIPSGSITDAIVLGLMNAGMR